MTKRIGIISDTHGFWDEAFERYFSSCDEIWHAGDIGNLEVTDKLNKIAPLKAVYGNIDHNEIRQEFTEDLYFKINNQKIMITHIAGKLGNYYKKCQDKISIYNPTIYFVDILIFVKLPMMKDRSYYISTLELLV